MDSEKLTLIIFLFTQAGALIWILSKHSADIENLKGWLARIDTRGDANGRNIGVLEGINDERHQG